MTPDLPAAVPEIPVSDVAAAAEYYRDRLGFTVDWLAADISLAGISRDACRLFLAGPAFRERSGTAGPVVIWLNLHSKTEVDDLHRAWRSTGAGLLSDPESKPWGLHEFIAADPDGNRLRVFYDFATPERERARSSRLDADGASDPGPPAC
jgi:catechol 2,3-dioxygenase-like lactoylglutathione lyase family enzyme